MKKIIGCLALLISINSLFGSVYNDKQIFIKEDKAYFLEDNKEISGIVTSEKNGKNYFTTYISGKKIKEKILNNERDIIADYIIDNNGLISGRLFYTNDIGETINAEIKNGIINGNAKQSYNGQIDFEGEFQFGIAHGKVKSIDVDGNIAGKIYYNGLPDKLYKEFMFSKYFSSEFLNSDILENKNKINSSFTGLTFSQYKGYINEATFYDKGVKEAEFYFQDGFMLTAKVFKNITDYIQYDYLNEINKGILGTIGNYLNNEKNGIVTNYYISGGKSEINYNNGKKDGKAFYYNEKNEIITVEDYNGDSCKQINYYDYKNNKIKSENQGIYTEYNEYFKTGTEIYYYENQAIETKIEYLDNDYAYKTVYYPEGKIKKEEGEIEIYSQLYFGEVKEYSEKGLLNAKFNYVDGVRDGKQIYYDEEGKEIRIENYDYGYLLE